MFRKNRAFTFAELAIVMLILGIVAMMTVPGLRRVMQRSQFERGAQKAYLTFNEAFDEAVVLYGPPHTWSKNPDGKVPTEMISEHLKIQDNGLTTDGMELIVNCDQEKCSFTADVNGPKKEPNLYGKDIFEYELYFSKLDPADNKKGTIEGSDNEVDITDRVIPLGDAAELQRNSWRFTNELWDKAGTTSPAAGDSE